MENYSLCRTCLGQVSLNPIFVDSKNRTEYSKAIFDITGLKVEAHDGLPQKICSDCVKFLDRCLVFRDRCQQSEISLMRMKHQIESDKKPIDTQRVVEEEICITEPKTERLDEDDEPLKLIVDKHWSQDNKYDNFNIENGIKTERNSGNSMKQECTKQMEVSSAEKNPKQYKVKTRNHKTKVVMDSVNITKQECTKQIEVASAEKNPEQHKVKIRNHKTKEIVMDSENITKQMEVASVAKNPGQHIVKILNHNMKEVMEIASVKTKPKKRKVKTKKCKTKVVSDTELLYEALDVGGKQVECKLCLKELSIRSIDLHITRHHPVADGKRVKCELCDTYVTREKLNRHTLLMHGSETFRCIYCKCSHESRASLAAHALTCAHEKKKRKPNEAGRALTSCGECGKRMQRASLRAHLRLHAGLQPVCEHCGLRLGNKLRLAEHYRAKHGYEKLQCRYCEFRSACRLALANHERQHRGERPFVCERCGARFHARSALARHRHSHRTDRPVKCPQCPATFKAASSLHSHALSVHARGVFRCGECGRGYRARQYVIRHLRQVHRFKGSDPPVRKETEPICD